MSFLISQISKFTQERLLLKTLISICLFSSLLLSYDLHYFQFFLMFAILFISSNIIESVDSSLFAKIMPSNPGGSLNKFLNPGLMIILTTTGGRFFGSLIISIFGYLFGFEFIQLSVFVFLSIFYLIIVIVVIRNYDHLRVKAISRIIRKKYLGLN